MSKKVKNVFISHIHKDDEKVAKLKELIDKGGMKVRDGSITSDKPNHAKNEDYIKNSILKPRIDWASTLVVLISPQTKDSRWVNWEIEYAMEQGKTIVGVWEQGAKASDLPEPLEKNADALHGWNSSNIIDAINGKNNEFQNPEGVTRPKQQINRYSCG